MPSGFDMQSAPVARIPIDPIRWSQTAVLALLIAVAGCESLDRPVPDLTRIPGEIEATSLSDRGEYANAEKAYRNLAQVANGAAAQRYLILAARELARAGSTDAARRELSRIADSIAPENENLWLVVTAETDLMKRDERTAIERLERVSRDSPPDLLATAYALLGEAYFRNRELVKGVTALSRREPLLRRQVDIDNNRRRIWNGLRRDEKSLAEAARNDTADATVRGWLELAAVTIATPNGPASIDDRLAVWRSTYSWHMAAGDFFDELSQTLSVALEYPAKVLLVLPLTGPQAAAGSSVRDGSYATALRDPGTFIVGPLLKRAVEQLAGAGPRVPALALNFLPDEMPTPSGFFQFSLSPEDEARQSATRALRDGHRRAIVLAPNTGWGRRLLTAFTSAMDESGGEVVTYRFYDPGATDLSSTIESLLLLDESTARERRLSANLRKALEFEPRRRNDFDLLFLAANSAGGRLVRPQLRFHYAADIPVYSTSAIYQVGAGGNRDLDGVMFPDMPWVVDPEHPAAVWRKTLSQLYPSRFAAQDRLFAMGFDAHALVPWLYERIGYLDRPIAGATGTLLMDDLGRIRRQLPWAVVSDGKAQQVRWLPALIQTGYESDSRN
jgi:outer membrane PBP1 activator LpoA protein